MKPILFATNYTPASENAGDYAAQLARQLGTSMILLHAWTIPPVPAEPALVMPDTKLWTEGEALRVKENASSLHKKWNTEVSGIDRNGFAPEEIIDVAKDNQVSLIVMGTHEHNLLSRIGGNTVTSLMHRAGFPILLVPESTPYKAPRSILLASDITNEPSGSAVSALKTFVHRLGAYLEVVTVQHPEHIWNIRTTQDSTRLEHSLRFCDHSWKYEFTSDVPEGIQHAAHEVQADWIAIAPRHFNWFQSLFKRSTSGKLAFSSDKPLLILPAITN